MITLPWPSPKLSQNARVHWAVKAKAVRSYKFQCVAILSQFKAELKGQTRFTVTFHPPSARRYDRDGLIARAKAAQDALAHVCGVDDFHFRMTYAFGAPVKGGSVVVSVDAAQARAA